MTTNYFDPQRKALILVAADGSQTVVTDRTQWARLIGPAQTKTAARKAEQASRGNHGGYGVSRSGKR